MIKWKLVDCGPDGLRPRRVMRVRALWDQIKERAQERKTDSRVILIAALILLGWVAVKMSQPSLLDLAATIPIPPELAGY